MTHPGESGTLWRQRAAYADPPYLGRCSYYQHEHGDWGCWDSIETHRLLIERLVGEYDGWALHLQTSALRTILPLCPSRARVAAWVKPFASFKPGISPAYAWEPVVFVSVRNAGRPTPRDWLAENITMQKGLIGAKPAAVVSWVFSLLGLRAGDELVDLFPGTGIVGETWAAAA